MYTLIPLIPQNDPALSGMMVFDLKAGPLFEQARHRAQLYHFISMLVGKPRELIGLDTYSEHTVYGTSVVAFR